MWFCYHFFLTATFPFGEADDYRLDNSRTKGNIALKLFLNLYFEHITRSFQHIHRGMNIGGQFCLSLGEPGSQGYFNLLMTVDWMFPQIYELIISQLAVTCRLWGCVEQKQEMTHSI